LQAIAYLSAAIALLEDINQILTMKNTDWQRLLIEGESLCATLRQHNYQCRKQTRCLSWKLIKEGQDDYILAIAPAPVSNWTLMPNDTSTQREQLWQLIEHTLTSIRRESLKTQKESSSVVEDYSRPWRLSDSTLCQTVYSSPIFQPPRCRRSSKISQPFHACFRI
jgi:hypothetical protein